MSSATLTSSRQSRLEALKKKHSILSAEIEAEQKMPWDEADHLQKLKKQKLYVKEQLESLKKTGLAEQA